MSDFILALDQGTTSCRAVLFNRRLERVDMEQREFTQHFPHPGWVEHDLDEIWEVQSGVLETLIRRQSLRPAQVIALGITNQRETWAAWDKSTGRPLGRAIVWQDRRTADRCAQLRARGLEADVRRRTGLLLDPYFSGTKAEWLLRHNDAVRAAGKAGRLAFGTLDSFLVYRLTEGNRHVTEAGNASRTLLFNLRSLDWDAVLLRRFGVPRGALPEVLDSNADFGAVAWPLLRGVKIHGIAGDQQAALFGHRCFRPGNAKNTYGTGCFLLRNVGNRCAAPPRGLLGTVAWRLGGRTTYAHEGAVLVAGAALQFLRDGLGLIAQAGDSEALAQSLAGNDGVYFVPAFAGLGTPHWDASARGAILGLTRGTTRAHLARAALEAIAYQTCELVRAFGVKRAGCLRVDGGGSHNRFLMQFQADILGAEIEVSDNPEVTALGAALLAALGAGALSWAEFRRLHFPSHRFRPRMAARERTALFRGWTRAVARAKGWAEPEMN